MTQISIKDQVKKLVELQKIDREVYTLKQDLKEKPLIIDQLKSEFEATKAHLKGLEEKFKGLQVKRKDLELELGTKEDEIKKANGQLSQLKTNKEYSAKMAEIESIKADKSIAEEKILISYDEADVIAKDIEKEKVKVAETEKGFLSKKKEIEDQIKQIQDRMRTLENERSQYLPGIEPNFINRYERVLEHKQGIAIAPIVNSTCGGCFMHIPQQTINAIKMNDQMVVCEMCTRILYLEEDL